MYEKKTKTFSKLPKSLLGIMSLSLVTVAVMVNTLQKEPIRIVPLKLPESVIPSIVADPTVTLEASIFPSMNTPFKAVTA